MKKTFYAHVHQSPDGTLEVIDSLKSEKQMACIMQALDKRTCIGLHEIKLELPERKITITEGDLFEAICNHGYGITTNAGDALMKELLRKGIVE